MGRGCKPGNQYNVTAIACESPTWGRLESTSYERRRVLALGLIQGLELCWSAMTPTDRHDGSFQKP